VNSATTDTSPFFLSHEAESLLGSAEISRHIHGPFYIAAAADVEHSILTTCRRTPSSVRTSGPAM
jgi:hypothetical protein